MKFNSYLFSLLFLILSNGLFAQTKAITDKGEEVILFDNGTWKSLEQKPSYDTRLDTPIYSKPANANFQIKSTRNSSALYINPKQWIFKKKDGLNESEQEYSFNLKAGDAYAMMITEQIEIPLNSLAEIALSNMQSIAPDGHIIKDEYRLVNGQLVKCLQMEGQTKGVEFTFYGYYFTGKNCTTQLVGYTSKKLFPNYEKDIEDLLNGLSLQ